MSEFDPYLEWFQIEKKDRPPNHYALLGVALFADDSPSIEDAYQKRYALARKYQVGERSADALRLLQELTRAYDCVTDPSQKVGYDTELRTKLPPEKRDADAKPTRAPRKDKTAETERTERLVPLEEMAAASPAPSAAPAPAPAVIEQADWYYIADERTFGPITRRALAAAVADGRLNGRSFVWKVGWQERRPAVLMFPELESAPGFDWLDQLFASQLIQMPSAVAAAGYTIGPYQKADPQGAFFILKAGTLLLATTALVALSGLTIAAGLGRSIAPLLGLGLACLALVGFAGSILESLALFESPPARFVRRALGDGLTRGLLVGISSFLTVIGLGMIGRDAVVGVLRRALGKDPQASVVDSGLPTVPTKTDEGGSAQDKSTNRGVSWKKHRDWETSIDGMSSLAVSADHRFVVVGAAETSNGLVVRLSEPMETVTLVHQGQGILGVAISPDSAQIATAGKDGKVSVWQADGKLRGTLAGHTQRVTDVRFSRDGKLLASTSEDRTLRVWRVADLQRQANTPPGISPLRLVDFSPNGRLVAAIAEGDLTTYRVESCAVDRTISGGGSTYLDVRFGQDSGSLTAVAREGNMDLFQLANRTKTTTKLADGRTFRALAINADGSLVAGADGQRISLISPTGTLLGEWQAEHDVSALAFDRSGSWLVSGGGRRIVIWQR